MRFRVLGPLEVAGNDETLIALLAPKQRTLLTVLLLHANQRVARQRLMDALWPGRPPRSAAGLLRSYVFALRHTLALREPGRLPALVTDPGGYQLTVAHGDLDLAVFQDLAAQGRRALEAGDARLAAGLLRDALDLWRGDVAEDVVLDTGTETVVAGLRERRLAAEETWHEARLALGGGGQLVARLRGLAAQQPFRQRLHGQLMLALYRAGRGAEALDVFQALRRRLAGELGVEPSPAIQRLHQRILAGDPALTPASRPLAAAPSTTAPLTTAPLTTAPAPAVVPRQLPAGVTDFTGRQAYLDRLDAMLTDGTGDPAAGPVVAIGGMAGAGKTALAVHWAHLVSHRFLDGQIYLDLRGFDIGPAVTPLAAVQRILRSLGAAKARVPRDIDEAVTMYRSLLADHRLLLLLDNAMSVPQVRPLLPGSGRCLVLVTSRSRLGGLMSIDGATWLTVGPLAESEALSLLRKILGDARVDGELPAARDIAARCAGLPLAIRIAAERAAYRPRLTLADLAAELAVERHRLDVLTAGEDRYATVRSVFSWSYHRLTPDAARVFRLLGLHPGPDITVPAGAALAGISHADAARLLDELAGAHLVEEAAPSQYRCHELLRAYAAELRLPADRALRPPADGRAR